MSAAETLNLEPETLNNATVNTVSPSSLASPSQKLPPSERDFQIYDAIHIDGSSTRYQAEKHEISQTRIRQVVRRVVERLGEVLPPQTKVAKEQETHLARQIAADRFQRQFEQINSLWIATLESKFASIRIRLTTAQARLGAVGGLIDGLAADAIEGLPVPIWQPPVENREGNSNWEGEAPAEPSAAPDSKSKFEYPNPLFPPPALVKKGLRNLWKHMPHQLTDPLYEHEITPEIVAARAAWGCPIPPDWIQRLQDQGKYPRDGASVVDEVGRGSPDPASQSEICNLKSEIPPPPPLGACSPSNEDSSHEIPANAGPIASTHAPSTTCEQIAESPNDELDAQKPLAQPLLNPQSPAPAIEVRISPDHAGAATVPHHPASAENDLANCHEPG